MKMSDINNNWVVFGMNRSTKVISEILGNRISFFISYNRDNLIYKSTNKDIFSLSKVKNSLADKKILLGYYDPEIDAEMRELLKDTDAKEIHSFCDIIWLDEYGEYDYTVILDTMWEQRWYSEFEYHLGEWRNYTRAFLIKPISDILQKYHMVEKKRLIDVACGYGFWSRFFCKKGFQVGAIDHNVDRLKVLRTISSNEHLNILIQESDIRNMEENINDNSYDISCCFNTIHVVSAWRKVISEMLRITDVGGYIVLVIANLDNENLRAQYKYAEYLQWDATKDNIISEVQLKARLIDEMEVYRSEDVVYNSPSHFILVIQK